MKIWQVYFFKEIFKVFFFFLAGFFMLYSLIEYSTHMNDFFRDSALDAQSVAFYYFNQFLSKLDFLLPTALLLSTIKVLTTLNTRNEWTVLQIAGLSSRQLLRPFFMSAIGCSLLLAFNFQFFMPKGLEHVYKFRITHFQSSHRAKRSELIHLLPLKDGSKLIYQTYLPEKQKLFDVWWIKSSSELLHMKYLNGNPAIPEARFVDCLRKNEEGYFEKVASYDSVVLTDLKWHPKMARKGLTPFDERSISELFKLLKERQSSPYEICKIKTAICLKTTFCLLSPLVVLATAPWCLKFSRHRSIFFIYALGIFGLFSLYMVLDSLSILADHGIISPFMALFSPLGLLYAILSFRYWRQIS